MRKHNLHKRELAETLALYEGLKGQGVCDIFEIAKAAGHCGIDPPTELAMPVARMLYDLLKDERYLVDIPPPQKAMTLRELTEYRQLLFDKKHFLANGVRTLKLLDTALAAIIVNVFEDLPRVEAPTPFTIPLVHTHPNPKALVGFLSRWLRQSDFLDRGMFRKVSTTLFENLKRVSGRTESQPKKPLIQPEDSELAPVELVNAYLKGTPLADFLLAPVPLKLTRDDRMNHMHVVGGTGAGKTSLVEDLILHDLTSENPPALVVIDPHSDLIQRLVAADIPIADRLTLIDPRDIAHPPALNVFALNQERLADYDEATREQVTAGVIQTFDYLFTGLIGADLTAKQGVFFRYVARLMLTLPEALGRNATILDMLRLMSDATPYRKAIGMLPDIPRDFFERDFESQTFKQTKEQIRYRLQAILENPTMARLFTSPETKVDLFTEMNRGGVILVDTAKDFLKGASANFGRLFISLVLQAVLERAALLPSERRDTFLIIDEAASYFDSNIDDLLTEARKYRCGLVLAHQYLDQATHGLRASLAANTGAKFAAGLSASDARAMAPDMRTTVDFILSQPRLQFAAHVRNVTPSAISIPVTPGALSRQPRRHAEDVRRLLSENARRVSVGVAPTTAEPVSPGPGEDISREW